MKKHIFKALAVITFAMVMFFNINPKSSESNEDANPISIQLNLAHAGDDLPVAGGDHCVCPRETYCRICGRGEAVE